MASFEISDNFSLFLEIISPAAIFYAPLFSKKKSASKCYIKNTRLRKIVLSKIFP